MTLFIGEKIFEGTRNKEGTHPFFVYGLVLYTIFLNTYI